MNDLINSEATASIAGIGRNSFLVFIDPSG